MRQWSHQRRRTGRVGCHQYSEKLCEWMIATKEAVDGREHMGREVMRAGYLPCKDTSRVHPDRKDMSQLRAVPEMSNSEIGDRGIWCQRLHTDQTGLHIKCVFLLCLVFGG